MVQAAKQIVGYWWGVFLTASFWHQETEGKMARYALWLGGPFGLFLLSLLEWVRHYVLGWWPYDPRLLSLGLFMILSVFGVPPFLDRGKQQRIEDLEKSLAYMLTPRLDIVFDPDDQACMMVTQDAHGRTDRMYRVIVVNRSGSTVEGVSVWITEHIDQGSSILPQRLRFKDERFEGQTSQNYEQLSKIDPGKSAQRYVDVVSHFDASQDYSILMKFALTDIPNTLDPRRYILTLVAKSHNAPEQTSQFEIDTEGPFWALTFKPLGVLTAAQ